MLLKFKGEMRGLRICKGAMGWVTSGAADCALKVIAKNGKYIHLAGEPNLLLVPPSGGPVASRKQDYSFANAAPIFHHEDCGSTEAAMWEFLEDGTVSPAGKGHVQVVGLKEEPLKDGVVAGRCLQTMTKWAKGRQRAP